MRKIRIAILVCLFAVFGVCSAGAGVVDLTLFEYAFNIDGAVYSNSAPASVNLAAFDTNTGLGSIQVTLGGAGSHYVGLFVDHEIDEGINTWFNEYGETNGSPAAGQSWEIDEPGYVFGDIYDNFQAGALDGSNGVPSTDPEDVSMALAWLFNLTSTQTANLAFTVGFTAPASGFYLSQFDPDSNASIYFSSTLSVRDTNVIPEPSTLLLLGNGLAGAAWFGRRRFTRK